MDIRKIKKLIELLKQSEIAEIEIHEGEESVRISRHFSMPASNYKTPMDMPLPTTIATDVQPQSQSPAAESQLEEENSVHDKVIKSPMVGLFYVASSPNEEPFVKQGSHVKRGAVVCIIEAMKIMNQIESDVQGTIIKVLVEDGDFVEYGQPLFAVSESD